MQQAVHNVKLYLEKIKDEKAKKQQEEYAKQIKSTLELSEEEIMYGNF